MTIFHISIEFWGGILCVVAFVCMLAERDTRRTQKRIKIGMQMCCLLLMVTDSLYMGLRGNPADWVYWIVRVCKYLVFFSNYIYMILIVVYLWQLMSDGDEKMPKRLLAVGALSVMCIVLITVSQFNGMIFYFDDVNMYHRGTYYLIIQLAVVAQIILIFTVYIQYRKRLSRYVSYALIAYFVLSTVTTMLVVLGTGLSLQNFAVVIATQVMFAVDYVDMLHRLDKSEAAYSKANYAANHDSMTGICNKEWGMKLITEFVNGMREDDGASLCFIDIDDFKQINDKYGHMTGDYWIKEIAGLLRKICRKDDVICRFGGDEYLLLMKGIDDAEVIKSKFCQLSEHLKLRAVERGQEVHVSIGACMITGAGHSMQQAVKLADEALYEGKRGGKNTCVVYRLDSDVDKQPDKIKVNIGESSDAKDGVNHNQTDSSASVVYIHLERGEYESIKDKDGRTCLLHTIVGSDGGFGTDGTAEQVDSADNTPHVVALQFLEK